MQQPLLDCWPFEAASSLGEKGSAYRPALSAILFTAPRRQIAITAMAIAHLQDLGLTGCAQSSCLVCLGGWLRDSW